MLDVCLLGCGGMMPLPKRFLTALIVRHEGKNILVDCGESTQVALHLSGFSTKNIDNILITHFHGDHVSGLPGLLLTIANHHREAPLHIWGGEGLTRIVSGLTVICEKLPYEVVLHELPFHESSHFMVSGLEVTTLPVKHRVPCLAYSFELKRQGKFDVKRAEEKGIPKHFWSRLQKGETITFEGNTWQPEDVLGEARKGLKLTYATDCRPSEAMVEFASGSDLLIAEGLYGSLDKEKSAREKGHMTYREAATIAKDAKVKALWLTHFSPALMNPKEDLPIAKAIFENTEVGHNLKMTTLYFEET